MPSFHLPHFNDIVILRSIEPNRFRAFLLRFDNYLVSVHDNQWGGRWLLACGLLSL